MPPEREAPPTAPPELGGSSSSSGRRLGVEQAFTSSSSNIRLNPQPEPSPSRDGSGLTSRDELCEVTVELGGPNVVFRPRLLSLCLVATSTSGVLGSAVTVFSYRFSFSCQNKKESHKPECKHQQLQSKLRCRKSKTQGLNLGISTHLKLSVETN